MVALGGIERTRRLPAHQLAVFLSAGNPRGPVRLRPSFQTSRDRRHLGPATQQRRSVKCSGELEPQRLQRSAKQPIHAKVAFGVKL